MSKPRYLTKSRFKLAAECPTKLYYAGKPAEYADAQTEDTFLAALAEGGFQVGALAKELYADGIEIFSKDHAAAVEETNKYLAQENVVLFEPAIRVGNFFIRIDILVKAGSTFELIEVKAKSYDSRNPDIKKKRGEGIASGMLPYIQDVAFQRWVLRQAFPTAEIKSFLMMPDKAKPAPIDGVNQIFKILKDRKGEIKVRNPSSVNLADLARELLHKLPADEYADMIDQELFAVESGKVALLPEAAAFWAEAYQADTRIKSEIGGHCGGCQYKAPFGDTRKSGFRECWAAATNLSGSELESGTVLDLWNFRKKDALIKQGVYKLTQLNEEAFSGLGEDIGPGGLTTVQRQWLQVGGLPSDQHEKGFYFDRVLASRAMSSWKYPLHMIDFETSSVALPFYKGMRPYQSVGFQFSHHVMYADGKVAHVGEFICTEPGDFPNYKFVRALMEQLQDDQGTVFMWSPHENTILTQIRDQMEDDGNAPDDSAALKALINTLIKDGDGSRTMVDLCDLASKAYFHPDTKGSNSIKKVLPAVLKSSEFLRSTYSQPIYGAPGGIPSINFKDVTWLDLSDPNCDPYRQLKKMAGELTAVAEDEGSDIADGGAAATAYSRLQFEDIGADERQRINSSLLRYCELDTLAMVMVVQAWAN